MGKMAQMRLQRFVTYALLLAGVLVVTLPFWYMFITSLKPQSLIFEMPPRLFPAEVTLKNYTAALSKDLFGLYFLNSLFVATASTGLTVIVSSMLAFAFARLEFPGKEIIFRVFLVGMMIPPVMLIIPQFIVAKWLGLYNSLFSLIFVYVTMNLSMQTFLLRGVFEGIPRDLEEAALIDGAGPFRILSQVLVPLMRPALTTVAILGFMGHWNNFFGPFIYLNKVKLLTAAVGLRFFRTLYGESQRHTEHLLMAGTATMTIPVLIIFAAAQQYFVSGVVMTGLKL